MYFDNRMCYTLCYVVTIITLFTNINMWEIPVTTIVDIHVKLSPEFSWGVWRSTIRPFPIRNHTEI